MKSFKQHIFEKLKVSSNKDFVEHTLFPSTKNELLKMIEDERSKNGDGCSLNHIDVSKITDMQGLFLCSNFNGDISKWDVSNVKSMKRMFKISDFNGDISNWDVSSVENAEEMFMYSKFNGDISNWNVSRIKNMEQMFSHSPLENNPPAWYKA